jgi:hypothetical protein
MKLSPNAEAALRQPDTQSVSFEMTPERRKKFSEVTGKVHDLLKANTDSPLEGYMCLQFLVHSFEEVYGIRGGVIVDDKDVEKNG